MHTHFNFLNETQAVFIDLDGTLLNTLGDFVAALNGMLAYFGAPSIQATVISQIVGQGSEHLVSSVLTQQFDEANRPRLDQALAVYYQIYANINGSHTVCYPGAKAGIALLHQLGIPTACITNKPVLFAKKLLKQYSLPFEFVLGGDNVTHKKPHPEPLLHACKHFNIHPHQAVMIGDSIHDAHAAHAAGMPCLLVPYGYNYGIALQTLPVNGIVKSILSFAKHIQQK